MAKEEFKNSLEKIKRETAEEWTNGKSKMMPPIISGLINKENDVIKYTKKRYAHDKEIYLNTGNWPETLFYRRDSFWSYYHYLSLIDEDINLGKYLDFEYDTNIWTKEDLLHIVNKYGHRALFELKVYLDLDRDMTFDEYMTLRQKYKITDLYKTKVKKLIKD